MTLQGESQGRKAQHPLLLFFLPHLWAEPNQKPEGSGGVHAGDGVRGRVSLMGPRQGKEDLEG